MKIKRKLRLEDALKVVGAITLGGLTSCAGIMSNYQKHKTSGKDREYLIPVLNEYQTFEENLGDLKIFAAFLQAQLMQLLREIKMAMGFLRMGNITEKNAKRP